MCDYSTPRYYKFYKSCLFLFISFPISSCPLISKQDLWYVYRRAIFDAGMGRDDGHYHDVLSSGVNLFLVEGSLFLFHPLVIYHLTYRKQISGIMPIYQATYTFRRPKWLPTYKIHKAAILSATLKRKTTIKPFAYYPISKGFEMVTCDVGILYCIESLQ